MTVRNASSDDETTVSVKRVRFQGPITEYVQHIMAEWAALQCCWSDKDNHLEQDAGFSNASPGILAFQSLGAGVE
ncbi:hypothetical protein PG988_001093 [Apiospora saccharicola]